MRIIYDGLFLAILAKVAVSDWNTKKIKNCYSAEILILGLIVLLGDVEISDSLFSALAGAGVSAAPLFLASMFVRGSFGGGDIKFMAAAGWYLGPTAGFSGLFLGLLSAAFYGIYLKIWKKRRWKDVIPIGPFLAFGLAAVRICQLF